MHLTAPHPWDLEYGEARRVQEEMARLVRLEDEASLPGLVAGVDVAFDRRRGLALAAAVSFTFPGLDLVEERHGSAGLRFPYIPGLLSFREGPAVLDALGRLERAPDLLIFDGQGIAHPRRFGLASHMGVITGIPSIGAAKSRLVGRHEEPGMERGESTPLLLEDEEIGRVLRTRTGVRPLYVSPGHRVTVEGAARLVLACCTRFRLPEPTRAADRQVALAKKKGR